MSPTRRNAAQWALAAALALGVSWAAGTTVFAPRGGAAPDAVLDAAFVLPPNYTDFGFSPRELVALFAGRGYAAAWERQGAGRYVLRLTGADRLTGVALDAAFQLRPVAGPGEVVSQVVGFTGPAVVVEAMSEGGLPARWAETTRLFEGLQTALAEVPGTRMHAIMQEHRAQLGRPAPWPGAPRTDPSAADRGTPPGADRPAALTPTQPR